MSEADRKDLAELLARADAILSQLRPIAITGADERAARNCDETGARLRAWIERLTKGGW